jgi:four helix bundle protein
MATVQRFEELKVWQAAFELDKRIWNLVGTPDFNRDSSLRTQLLRSAGSVPDNIAEGFERGTRNEFLHFLSIAKGSAGEVRSQLHRAVTRQFISEALFEEVYQLADQVGGMIRRLTQHLNRTTHNGLRYKVEEEELAYETAP